MRDNRILQSNEMVMLKHDRSTNEAGPSRMLQAMAYAPVSFKEKEGFSNSA